MTTAAPTAQVVTRPAQPPALDQSGTGSNCQTGSDVVFILDTSGVNAMTNVASIKEYLVSQINSIDLTKPQITAGFLTFPAANPSQPQTSINSYSERLELSANSRTIFYAAGAIVSTANSGNSI